MQWIGVGYMPGNNWSGGTRDDVIRLGSWLGLMSQSHADLEAEQAGSRGDLITAQRYGERIARLTQRWVNAVPYDTPRMTEHEARALSASLREADDAPAALTGA
jgi:NAD(P)H dehydrogenase (quinone)